MTVHVLLAGRALCAFSDSVPKDWPEGHSWVGSDDAYRDCTCDSCNLIAGIRAGKSGQAIEDCRAGVRTGEGMAERHAHGCPLCRHFNRGIMRAYMAQKAALEELVAADAAMKELPVTPAGVDRYNAAMSKAREILGRAP